MVPLFFLLIIRVSLKQESSNMFCSFHGGISSFVLLCCRGKRVMVDFKVDPTSLVTRVMHSGR